MNAAKIARRKTDQLIKGGKGEDIERVLRKMAIPICIVRECMNEPRRRASMEARVQRRKERKEASKFGAKGERYRRVVFVETYPNPSSPLGKVFKEESILFRERSFHATKGWRSNRVML